MHTASGRCNVRDERQRRASHPALESREGPAGLQVGEMDLPMPVRSSQKPKGPRRDPRPRPNDGLKSYNDVINPKPGYKYVLAALDGEMNPDYYEAVLGYSRVIYAGDDVEGCTKLRAGRFKKGEPIITMSQMLMEIGPKEGADLERVGHSGMTGQELCDRIEGAMLDGGVEVPRGENEYFTQDSQGKRSRGAAALRAAESSERAFYSGS